MIREDVSLMFPFQIAPLLLVCPHVLLFLLPPDNILEAYTTTFFPSSVSRVRMAPSPTSLASEWIWKALL